MDAPQLSDSDLAVFVEEVELQSALAIRAYEDMHTQTDPNATKRERFDHLNLHAFAVITHAGNLSKLFWSPRAKADARTAGRCAQLRHALQVDDQWLIAGRETRNHLEHYDERLDDWLRTPNRKPRADMEFVFRGQLQYADGKWTMGRKQPASDRDYHRNFDPGTNTVYVMNTAYDLGQVLHEIIKLHWRAERWLIDHGQWFEEGDDE